MLQKRSNTADDFEFEGKKNDSQQKFSLVVFRKEMKGRKILEFLPIFQTKKKKSKAQLRLKILAGEVDIPLT